MSQLFNAILICKIYFFKHLKSKNNFAIKIIQKQYFKKYSGNYLLEKKTFSYI